MVDLRAESAATISPMTFRLWTIRAPHALAISHQIVYQLRVQQASLGIVVESAAMTFRVLVSTAYPNYHPSHFLPSLTCDILELIDAALPGSVVDDSCTACTTGSVEDCNAATCSSGYSTFQGTGGAACGGGSTA